MRPLLILSLISILATTPTLAANTGIGLSTKSDDTWISVPIDISESFRLEPALRYFKDRHSQPFKNTEKSTYEISMGIFGRSQLREKVNFYYGGRLAYIENKFKTTEVSLHNNIGGIHSFPISYSATTYGSSAKSDGYRVAPTIGFEYHITPRFTLGAEAAWNYLKLKSNLDNSTYGHKSRNYDSYNAVSSKNTHIRTNTRILARFYF